MNLTQVEVAKLVGITTVAYQNYEANRHTPNVKIAKRIAKALNSTVDELF